MLPPVGMLENVFRGSGKFLQKVAALDLRDRSCRVSSGRSKRKQMNIYSVMADQDFCYLKVGTNNSNNLIRGGGCVSFNGPYYTFLKFLFLLGLPGRCVVRYYCRYP